LGGILILAISTLLEPLNTSAQSAASLEFILSHPTALPRLSFFSGLSGVSAREKINHKNNDRSYKQQVNQAGGYKAAQKPNQPQQQQHYKNCP
jgi:hypothetical protein